MSEGASPPVEESAPSAEVVALQEQLKAVAAERDRVSFEKNEIIARANAISAERDDFRSRLTATQAERDRLAGERADLARRLDEVSRQAEIATAEATKLRAIVEAAPQKDPAELLLRIAADKTAAAVAWMRSKIPADSPALPWFDKAVETIASVGCMAVKAADAFIRWAVPQAIRLTQRLAQEIEARLAKK